MPRIVAVTSGKGGVGKSNFVLNVGIALAMMDCSVQILDADLGLANLDVLLGERPLRSLDDVVMGNARIEDIIIKTEYGVNLIPGSSGTQEMTNLSQPEIDKLVQSVAGVSGKADFLLVDTGAGISKSVISFLLAVPEVMVAVSPEPTSLTDAYALIKVLNKNGFSGRLTMFASSVKDSSEGRAIYKKIASAAQRFLNFQVEYSGCVVRDDKLGLAVSEQSPVIARYPSSEIARSYRVIATTLLGQEAEIFNEEKFWNRLVKMMLVAAKPKQQRVVPLQNRPRGGVDGMLQAILDEQRRTRILLERIVFNLEKQQEKKQPETEKIEEQARIARRSFI